MKKTSSASCNPPGAETGKTWNFQAVAKYFGAMALVFLVIFFYLANPRFLGPANITNLLKQMSPLMIVSVGTTFVILMGSIDLSIDGTVTLAGIISVLVANQVVDMHFLPGCLLPVFAGVGVGLVVGLVNGLLQARLRLPSFLVTLGMTTICSGVGLIITNGTAIRALNNAFKRIAIHTIGVVPILGIVAVTVLILGYIIFKRTLFGRYAYAIGGGERVAELCGVPIARYKIMVFLFAGALSGLAGALTSSRLGAATNLQGSGMALDAIAAVVMGGTALSGGKGGILNTLVGILVIILLANGLNMMGVQPYTQTLIKGLVVILAVAMTSERRKMVVK